MSDSKAKMKDCCNERTRWNEMILHLLNSIPKNSDQQVCPELNIFNVEDGRKEVSSTTEDSLLKECWTFEMLKKLQEGQYGAMSGECMIHNVVTTQQTITCIIYKTWHRFSSDSGVSVISTGPGYRFYLGTIPILGRIDSGQIRAILVFSAFKRFSSDSGAILIWNRIDSILPTFLRIDPI